MKNHDELSLSSAAVISDHKWVNTDLAGLTLRYEEIPHQHIIGGIWLDQLTLVGLKVKQCPHLIATLSNLKHSYGRFCCNILMKRNTLFIAVYCGNNKETSGAYFNNSYYLNQHRD